MISGSAICCVIEVWQLTTDISWEMNDWSALYSYRLIGDFLLFLLLCLSSLRYYFGIAFVELISDYTGFWFQMFIHILDCSGEHHGWDIFRRLTTPEKHLINRWQTVMKIDQYPGFILICVEDYRSLLRQLNSRKCKKNWLTTYQGTKNQDHCESPNEGEARLFRVLDQFALMTPISRLTWGWLEI